MAARTLPLLAALALSWHPPAHRLPLLIAAVGVAVATIFTIGYALLWACRLPLRR